jgi:hypothetical protein
MSRFDHTSDLLEMRAAFRTGNSTRVAELRSAGRGACCEFHRDGGVDSAAPAARRPTADEELERLLQIGIDFYNREAEEAERNAR